MTFDNALRYRIINENSKLVCAADKKSGETTRITQHLFHEAADLFRLIQLVDGSYEIMQDFANSPDTSKCFTSNGDRNPILLQPWKFINNNDQRWIISQVSNKLYKIQLNTTNKVLTVNNCTTTPGENIVLEEYKELNCQKWKIECNEIPDK